MTRKTGERFFLVAWALVTTWLLVCAFIVQGEYGDGYQTIVNARYFFADSPGYFVQRGPLAAVALWPVEVIVQALNIDPLDVRPYHLLSAALHSAYLYLCWLLLQRAPGDVTAKLVAFGSAILSIVFYAYSPYLSHDLLPGLLFLALIFVGHRWLEKQQPKDAVWLIVIGAGAVLVKQTYAIFWVTLFAYALIAWILKWDNGRVDFRKLASLAVLGAISAVISYLCYSLFIGGELPDEPLLTRPVRLMAAVTSQYNEELTGIFPADIYLRNLHNYGIAAMLLVIPGVVMAFRGKDSRMRIIAFCWLTAAVIVQLIDFREVRYLAFLAPLSAMLIVPVATQLLKSKPAAILLVALVVVDQGRGLSLATNQVVTAPTANVTRFINAADIDSAVYVSDILSFVYDASSPVQRDRYQGIYHLTPLLLHRLMEGDIHVAIMNDMRELGMAGIAPGDRVYYANDHIIRRPPWDKDNIPPGLENYLVVAGAADSVQLVLNNGRYERPDNDGSYIMFLPSAEVGQQMPVISQGVVSTEAAATLFGKAAGHQELQVIGVFVDALCQSDSCSYR